MVKVGVLKKTDYAKNCMFPIFYDPRTHTPLVPPQSNSVNKSRIYTEQ